jgi:hypothetical protein
VEAFDGLWQSLVVAHEPSEACGPGEGPLDDPASGQQDEAPLSLGELDDLELDAVFGGVGGRLAGVALVRLSRITAVGRPLRSVKVRSKSRRSWTMASNTPALSQRWVCW